MSEHLWTEYAKEKPKEDGYYHVFIGSFADMDIKNSVTFCYWNGKNFYNKDYKEVVCEYWRKFVHPYDERVSR